MVFYVYIQPEIIPLASNEGPYAIQCLIALLRAMLQNCLIVEFQDYRIQPAIEDAVNNLPEDFDRTIIKSILSTLQKRNRFIYCVTPQYPQTQSDVEYLLQQARQLELDILVLDDVSRADGRATGIERCSLGTYQHTNFEIERSQLAAVGKTWQNGQVREMDFLENHFKKAIRYATRLEFCDKLFGAKYGDNYEYTIKILLRWLASFVPDPSKLTLIIHTAKPAGHLDAHIQTQLTSFRPANLGPMKIELNFYELPNPDQILPHERFLSTDQVTFEIGRGMDFLDRGTHTNRDVSISTKSPKEVDDLLKSYESAKTPTIAF